MLLLLLICATNCPSADLAFRLLALNRVRDHL